MLKLLVGRLASAALVVACARQVHDLQAVRIGMVSFSLLLLEGCGF
jgi:hypothetical protein